MAWLIPELEQRQSLHSHKQEEEQILHQFEQQLRELIAASKSVGKPIVF